MNIDVYKIILFGCVHEYMKKKKKKKKKKIDIKLQLKDIFVALDYPIYAKRTCLS